MKAQDKITLHCEGCGNEKTIEPEASLPRSVHRIVADYCDRKPCAKKHEGDFWEERWEDAEGNILDENGDKIG